MSIDPNKFVKNIDLNVAIPVVNAPDDKQSIADRIKLMADVLREVKKENEELKKEIRILKGEEKQEVPHQIGAQLVKNGSFEDVKAKLMNLKMESVAKKELEEKVKKLEKEYNELAKSKDEQAKVHTEFQRLMLSVCHQNNSLIAPAPQPEVIPVKKQKDIEDPLMDLIKRINNLNEDIKETLNNYKSTNYKKEKLEETKLKYAGYVDEFNNCKSNLINSYILELIILANKRFKEKPNLINEDREKYEQNLSKIRKFNDIKDVKLIQTCQVLKDLLIEICPEDLRLKSKGVLHQVWNGFIATPIFTSPGTNTVISTDTLEKPKDWDGAFTDKAFDLPENKEPNAEEKKEPNLEEKKDAVLPNVENKEPNVEENKIGNPPEKEKVESNNNN